MLQLKDVGLIYTLICVVDIMLVFFCIRQIRINCIQRDWTSALVFALNLIGLITVLYIFAESANLI